MRLLVVEDERDLADALARGLRGEGYAVDVAYTGEGGFAKASVNNYDLLCLDINLPGMSGRAIARRLRAHRTENGSRGPRIIMLTALGDLEDRVAGLDEGADDYLVKPFAFAELAARVRALLRREGAPSGNLLRVGSLELDAGRREARRRGRSLQLTPKEFALQRYFMSRH